MAEADRPRPVADTAANQSKTKDIACFRSPARLLVVFLALAGLLMPSHAGPGILPADALDPPAQEATAEFLFGESGGLEPRKGTAWKVHYTRGVHRVCTSQAPGSSGASNEDWIKILNDARVAELFVPYHQSSFIRYYDLTAFRSPWPRYGRKTPVRSAA